MTGQAQARVVVLPDAELLARTTAQRLLLAVVDAQSLRRPVHVVLTGGTVGIATLAAARTSPVLDAVDWSGVHVWWGDERFLPVGHEDRNDGQARAALLDHVPVPPGNVHAVPGPDAVDSPEAAAERYAADLAVFADDAADPRVPEFAVLLLGVGPDGHVASLFPGHPAADAAGVATVAVHDSPKPPPVRVSLTFAAIARAAEVWLVAAGAEKAGAVAAAVAGEPLPAGRVRGTERTLWLLDVAAAGGHA
jgi:6-phosphogluconolactonase